MRMRASVFVMAIGIAAGAQAVAADFASPAMPMGITLQPLGRAQGYGAQRWRQISRGEIVYSNAKGLTLYTYDSDEVGKSNCLADCAKTWLPAPPPAKAKPIAGWTTITRSDGGKQWAHDGKPLYTYKDDKEGGDVLGLGADPTLDGQGGTTGNEGKALLARLPEGWHVHKSHTGGESLATGEIPIGFKVHEVGDANAVVIVDAHDVDHEKVLYFYNGDISKDNRSCGTLSAECAGFQPMEAPALARAVGGWTVVDRKDGMSQWAYNGKLLYTYEADRITGDVHGIGVDKKWQLAALQSYFMPQSVRFQDDFIQGRILASSDGRTLYRRSVFAFNPASVALAHDRPYRPRIGRMTRGVSCNAVCAKAWTPYLAPSDAQPSGYWGVAELPGGKKQWTYKDFALYTYAGDKVAGDAFGDHIYDLHMGDDPNVDNDLGFPGLYKAGFYWIVATF